MNVNNLLNNVNIKQKAEIAKIEEELDEELANLLSNKIKNG